MVDLAQSGAVESRLCDPFRCLLWGDAPPEIRNVQTSKNYTPNLAQRNGALLGCRLDSPGAGLHAAEAKASKAAVHYRDYPGGSRMCQNCKFFISGGGGRSGRMGCPMGGGGMMGRGMMGAGACQLVEGRISPMGYCDLYVHA